MHLLSPRIFAFALGFVAALPLAASCYAGAAVASDGHGGYGYSYGDRPEYRLRREAMERCRRTSEYPDDVRIVTSTRRSGAGVIVRYRNEDGEQRIFACVGADDGRLAFRLAARGARANGAEDELEVVQRWID